MVQSIIYKRAFTLLEVVIYLALFSVIMTGVIRTVYALLETSREAETTLEIQNDGSFVLQKLAWALTDVLSVSTDGPTTLVIIRSDDVDHPLRFTVIDGRWYLARGSDDPTPLTSASHRVHDLTILLTHPTPASNYLKLSFYIDDAPFTLAWPQYE